MRNFMSVKNYTQGYDILNKLSILTKKVGKSPLLLSSKEDYDRLGLDFSQQFENFSVEFINGPSSYPNISNITTKVHSAHADFVIGIGGGKSIDIAKAIAYYQSLPIVVIPTIASTDGPCSSLVAIYDDSNQFLEYLEVGNPHMVIVDSKIIFNAPKRFFIAGIGDALSTFFEANICLHKSYSKTALGIASFSYSTIKDSYNKALDSYKLGYPNSNYEDIIESILLMSCIGFENTRLHLAHHLANIFNKNSETNGFLHGEKVALGTLIQLKIYDNTEFDAFLAMLKDLNLPTHFSDIGFRNLDTEFLETLKASILSYDKTLNISNTELSDKLQFFYK